MFITTVDIARGSKRVNVSLDIKTANKLAQLLEINANVFPGTLCKMYLTDIILKKHREAFKDTLPGQTSLFDKKLKKSKKVK